ASNDVGDGIANPVRERMRLHGNALFLREHDADEIFGTWQAARVCREESIGTAFHGTSSDCGAMGGRSATGAIRARRARCVDECDRHLCTDCPPRTCRTL